MRRSCVASCDFERLIDWIFPKFLSPALPWKIIGLLLQHWTNAHNGVIHLLGSHQLERSTNDARNWFFIVGESHKHCDIFNISVDESESTIDGIDPQACLSYIQTLPDSRLWGNYVEVELIIVVLDMPRILLGFLSDDFEVWEVHLESFNKHGLDFVVCLCEDWGTLVTGLSSPFM